MSQIFYHRYSKQKLKSKNRDSEITSEGSTVKNGSQVSYQILNCRWKRNSSPQNCLSKSNRSFSRLPLTVSKAKPESQQICSARHSYKPWQSGILVIPKSSNSKLPRKKFKKDDKGSYVLIEKENFDVSQKSFPLLSEHEKSKTQNLGNQLSQLNASRYFDVTKEVLVKLVNYPFLTFRGKIKIFS